MFHPDAALDTHLVDDLRTDPVARCLATDGVTTPAGMCVDAIVIWESELHPDTRDVLYELGYPRSIEHSTSDDQALIVPAGYVILGGVGGECVIAVDMSRPVTPRPVD